MYNGNSGGGGGGGGGGPRAGENGNWECTYCQNVNFAQRTVCNRCGEQPTHGGGGGGGGGGGFYDSRPNGGGYGQQQPSNAGGYGMAGAGMGGMGVASPRPDVDEFARDFVQCFGHEVDPVTSAITYLSINAHSPIFYPPYNTPPAQRAYASPFGAPQMPGGPMVGAKRQRGVVAGAAGGPPRAGEMGNWLCKECRNVNLAFRISCNKCHLDKAECEDHHGSGPKQAGKEENWKCKECDNINFGFRTSCNRCKLDKSQCKA